MREWIVPDNDIGVDGAYFDYQELLRCKDCTHYRGDHEYCENDMFAVESGFCNWAERKKE